VNVLSIILSTKRHFALFSVVYHAAIVPNTALCHAVLCAVSPLLQMPRTCFADSRFKAMYDKLKVPEFQDEVVPLHEKTQFNSLLDFLFAPKAAYVISCKSWYPPPAPSASLVLSAIAAQQPELPLASLQELMPTGCACLSVSVNFTHALQHYKITHGHFIGMQAAM
jgi:hypothetical protein